MKSNGKLTSKFASTKYNCGDGATTKSDTSKLEKVMKEGKAGKLRSGKHGPIVAHGSPQEIAIALSEARKAGENVAPKKRK